MSANDDLRVNLDRALSEILTLGGDTRLSIPSGARQNRYGCATEPDPEVVAFGSCTGSTIGPTGFHAAERLRRRLLALDTPEALIPAVEEQCEAIRQELSNLLVGGDSPRPDIVLTPSGTDAQLLILALAVGPPPHKPTTSIVVGPTELGSGTTLACEGLHFDELTPSGRPAEKGTPLDPSLASIIRRLDIWLRDDDGSPRSPDELDDEIEHTVKREIDAGRQVVLHVVAHSKTGIHAPTLESVERMKTVHGDKLQIVIDAAQGRFSRRGLRAALKAGYLVLVTGSKFYGGPPFSGAVLLPPPALPMRHEIRTLPEGFGDYFRTAELPRHWPLRAALPATPNLGLLFRWAAAIAEMREYYLTPSSLRLQVLRAFEAQAERVLGGAPNLLLESRGAGPADDNARRFLQSKATVFCFAVLDANSEPRQMADLRCVHRWMREDISSLLQDADVEERRALTVRYHLGQPVDLGRNGKGPAILRIALGGTLVSNVAQDMAYGLRFEDRLDWMERNLVGARDKLAAITENFDRLLKADSGLNR